VALLMAFLNGRPFLGSILALVVLVVGILLATFDMIGTRGLLPVRLRTALNTLPLFNSDRHFHITDMPDDLHNITILITGASSGIGHEAARLVADRGAKVILGTRGTLDRLKSIQQELGDRVLVPAPLDLGSFQSIRNFVGSLAPAGIDKIDLVLLNAGKMIFSYEEGELGIERMLAVHHIGHAYLFELLMPVMLSSPRPNVRVVFVSSSAHAFSYPEGIRFNSSPESFGIYFQAYANSKLANALYVRALSHRLEAAYPTKFIITAVNPGAVTTPFAWYQRYVPSSFSASPQDGALSVLSPLLLSEVDTDGYYDPLGLRLDWTLDTAYWWTCDSSLQDRLWHVLNRGLFRAFCTAPATAKATEAAAASTAAKAAVASASRARSGPGLFARMRSFTGGFTLASAIGFYLIFVQLQGMTDEVRSAVHDVAVRQARLEDKVRKIESSSSAAAVTVTGSSAPQQAEGRD
ncbi:hypothetical protein FOL47_000457, partial [Perkinsus chesapeaki]